MFLSLLTMSCKRLLQLRYFCSVSHLGEDSINLLLSKVDVLQLLEEKIVQSFLHGMLRFSSRTLTYIADRLFRIGTRRSWNRAGTECDPSFRMFYASDKLA